MSAIRFQLQRDAFGRLVLIDESGERHEGVTPVRAFPISAANEGLSMVSTDGHEIAWIERVSELPHDIAVLIGEELASREFVPEIERIDEVSSFACPSTWQVRTNRGPAQLVLKGEEDIRRLTATRLLIADANGIQFLVRDMAGLDRQSRKLLDRFL